MKSKYQHYQSNKFYIEGVSLKSLAQRVGTPFYAYSQSDIETQFHAYERAFDGIPHVICYALKANSNLAVARVISRLGGGADIVSGGELRRALRAGFPPNKIIFSGVGKTVDEMKLAIQSGIRLINVESGEELQTLCQVAQSLKKKAPFSLRVNPDVHAGGHPHISTGTPSNKFGVFHKNIFPLYMWSQKQRYLKAVGIQSHIGSQITNVAPYKRALRVMIDLMDALQKKGFHFEILDLGGGLGIDYKNDNPDSPGHLAKLLLPLLKNRNTRLFLEPGRSLVAQSGILVTRVLYRKKAGKKNFIIVDAAMNDLARPALYDAYHEILPVERRKAGKVVADIVGPICESGDYLARDRSIALPRPSDLLAVLSTGAYGFVMSSQYNTRPRVPEVLVSGRKADVVRKRETYVDLVKGEKIPKRLR